MDCALAFDQREEREPEQDVAGVRDGGVGKQAANARLREGGQVAEDHREHGEIHQDHRPDGEEAGSVMRERGTRRDNRCGDAAGRQVQHRGPPEDCIADGDEQGEAGNFGHGRDKGCCGSGRAFVGVGRPEMERDRSDLEAKARSDHHQRDVEQRRCTMGRHRKSAQHNLG